VRFAVRVCSRGHTRAARATANAYSPHRRHKRSCSSITLLRGVLAHPEASGVCARVGHFRLKHVRQRMLLSIALFIRGMACWLLTGQAGLYAALGVPVAIDARGAAAVRAGGPGLPSHHPARLVWRPAMSFRRRIRTAMPARPQLATALVQLHRDNRHSTMTHDPVYAAFLISIPRRWCGFAPAYADGQRPETPDPSGNVSTESDLRAFHGTDVSIKTSVVGGIARALYL